MKAIINGKRYDTATATEVCDCSPEGEARLLEHHGSPSDIEEYFAASIEDA